MIEATPGQHELWHLHSYTDSGTALNVPLAWRLQGALDPTRLAGAVDAVTVRHESLRSTFHETEDGLSLTVAAPSPGLLITVDVTDEAEAHERLQAFFDTKLDLTSGQPLAAVLIRWTATDHLFALSIHHAVMDEWSIRIIVRDLSVAFEGGPAFEQAVPYRLADVLPGMLYGRARALDFWAGQLGRIPDRWDIPETGSAFPTVRVRRRLAPETAQHLADRGREWGATPFSLLFAAIAGLLGRRANNDDFVIGVPIANRSAAATHEAVLYATNLIPLRVRLDGDPTFRDLTIRSAGLLLDAMEHSAASMAEIMRAIKAGGSSDVAGTAGVVITYRSAGTPLELGELTASPVPAAPSRSLYPLAVTIEHSDGSTVIEVESRILAPPSVEDLCTRLINTIAAVAGAPRTRLSDWPVALPTDPTPGAVPAAASGHTVVDMFLTVAGQRPQSIAASAGDKELTYSDLRSMAGEIGRELTRGGARPGDVVAVAVRRDLSMLTGLLGVMQAGCVYLPVDLDWPEHRVRTVLADSGATWVVRDSTHAAPAFAGLRVCQAPLEADATGPLMPSRAVPGDSAYVIYTSGSTGTPKGVQVGHAALAWLMTTVRGVLGVEPAHRMLATTTSTFDISLVEMLLPLCTGGTCVVADEQTVRDPALAAALVRARGINVVQGTPTWWSLIADHLDVPVDVAVTGGEALPARLRDRLLRVSRRAYNGYGPTEATIYASMWRLVPGAPIAVGNPLPGTVAWVIDRWDRPCTTGIVGRLFLGGAGLAEGYLGRPELTAERFRAGLPGVTTDRVYDTGDLASWGADGLLYLHGRSDNQIKLRGHRIELEEVESVIAEVNGVTGVAVVPYEQGEGQRGLAAFVQSDSADPALASAVRALVAERLPEYARPRFIRLIDALPQTSSGKIDRAVLAGLVTVPVDASPVPLSPLEERIAQEFRRVLGVTRIRPDDSFFALGGDSIGAARLLVRLRRSLRIELSLSRFVAKPTVAAIGRMAEEPQAQA